MMLEEIEKKKKKNARARSFLLVACLDIFVFAPFRCFTFGYELLQNFTLLPGNITAAATSAALTINLSLSSL